MQRVLKYAVPLLAIIFFAIAVRHVWKTEQAGESGVVVTPQNPPVSPFADCLAGAGIVEPQTQNISVGSAVPGIVRQVHVKVGDQVKAGAALFELDDRPLQSQKKIRVTQVALAQAEVNRLAALPRPEEVPIREAAMQEARATRDEKKREFDRTVSLGKAATPNDLDIARAALAVAQANLEKAEGELKLLKAGAWQLEKAAAQATVEQREAELNEVLIELERLVVRAAVDGEVLQVNVRPGEFVGAPPGAALVVLGDTKRLHVRVDIDEHDIPRFNKAAEAIALLRGHPEMKYTLRFRRVEPYVIPKRSLTGENTERIDTRVLQVIYEIDSLRTDLFVGQQMDVFLEISK